MPTTKPHVAVIVTHHESPKKVADILYKEGIVAIGFSKLGNLKGKTKEQMRTLLRKMKFSTGELASAIGMVTRFRDELKVGDIVLSYAGHNKVALVGKIKGKYEYNSKNVVGNLRGEIGYPNQRKVQWREYPRNFHREYLPKDLRDKVALPGTIHIFDSDVEKLEKALRDIPSEEREELIYEIKNEEEIKKHLKRKLSTLGLSNIEREFQTPRGPVDFFATDKGKPVLIEVKVTADENTIGQLLKYVGAYESVKKIRDIGAIVVASEFMLGCRMAVRAAKRNIKLYRCRFDLDLTEVPI